MFSGYVYYYYYYYYYYFGLRRKYVLGFVYFESVPMLTHGKLSISSACPGYYTQTCSSCA